MENALSFKYIFNFEDHSTKEVEINLEPNTLNSFREKHNNPPDWCRLSDFKCPHCPLDEKEFDYCPVAIDLIEIADIFKTVNSFDKVEVIVETQTRDYKKVTDAQEGVGSLAGIIMVSSGCPIMGNLKPLLRTHLPFSSLKETVFRVFSMYLLSQYYRKISDKEPDWEMAGLKKYYEDIHILDSHVTKKFSEIKTKDALRNALLILNNFTNSINFTFEDGSLEYIEKYFSKFDNQYQI